MDKFLANSPALDAGFMSAVAHGNHQSVLYLSSIGPMAVDTGIGFAALKYDIEMCRLLINLGATAIDIMFAGASVGRFDMVALAISSGATDYKIGCHYAARGGHWGICLLMFHLAQDDDTMFSAAILGACLGGQYAIIKRLIRLHDDNPGMRSIVLSICCQAIEICANSSAKDREWVAVNRIQHGIILAMIVDGAFCCTTCGRNIGHHQARAGTILAQKS